MVALAKITIWMLTPGATSGTELPRVSTKADYATELKTVAPKY